LSGHTDDLDLFRVPPSVSELLMCHTPGAPPECTPGGDHHGAQGVSADTTHGLLTGQGSRQQLYTMLTRGRQAVADLDHIDQHISGLTAEPAWPTLRTHLIALAPETGDHPYRHLQEAANGRDLSTANDLAAVLDWRLPDLASQRSGPLPWIPGVPANLQNHPVWGSYLAHRCQLVAELADLIKEQAALADTDPNWAPLESDLRNKLLGAELQQCTADVPTMPAGSGSLSDQDPCLTQKGASSGRSRFVCQRLGE
jgi:hypothetical protein